MQDMSKRKFTSDYYGKFQHAYYADELKIPNGFIAYHKANFSKYFNLSQDRFSGRDCNYKCEK